MKALNVSVGAGAVAFLLAGVSSLYSENIAPEGFAIIGCQQELNSELGEDRQNAGTSANINDGNIDTRVDTWGHTTSPDTDYSYVGILWGEPRTDEVTSIKLYLATFYDGGWFGTPRTGPGAGGTLTESDVVEPVVQVTSDGGATWSEVEADSNYLTIMTGHVIGNPAGTNPTRAEIQFILKTPQSGIDGIRIIGSHGGTAAEGFLGVFELEVYNDPIEIVNPDADDDGDGLTNAQEAILGTDKDNPDTDGDGLSDGAEVNIHNSNPLLVDSDGDGLSDGDEVNVYGSNPTLVDTDGDGLTDGAEVNTYLTNPVEIDTDGDGFDDGVEVQLRSNPLSAESIPDNIAPLGTPIIGTSTGAEGGTDFPHWQAGVPANLNDGNYGTRVDTFGRGEPEAYVGVIFPSPRSEAIDRVEVTFAIFFDGGWFGPNGLGPGSGGYLSEDDGYLEEPVVQVTTDGGATWTTVPASSNYLAVMNGHPLPATDFGTPTLAQVIFQLENPQTGIDGIRVIGSEGGTASGGFVGFFEFAVKHTGSAGRPELAQYASPIMGVSDAVDETPGTRYWHAGTLLAINDGVYTTRVDTWNSGGGQTASFVGLLWPAPLTEPLERLEVIFSLFFDGGWFGENGANPASGEGLSAPEHLVEPSVQVTRDGGKTWETVSHVSNYIPALTGMTVPGLPSPRVIFALETPQVGIDGIRLIGSEGGMGSNGFLGIFEVEAKSVNAPPPPNAAMSGTAILGTAAAVNEETGRRFTQLGSYYALNDGNLATRDTTFDGEGGDPVSYVGVLWTEKEKKEVVSVTLSIACFLDGGWFGPAGMGPGAGGVLSSPQYLSEPEVQVTTDGLNWTTAPHTSDYLTVFEGFGIGGGGNPNPNSATATFTLLPAIPSRPAVMGVRVIGEGGGTASGGFLGVNEISVQVAESGPGPGGDTDGDGMPDVEEIIAGTDPGNPASVLRLTRCTLNEAGTALTIAWQSVAGKTYRVQQSLTLAADSWSNVGDVITAFGAETERSVTLPDPRPAQYHLRVVVVAP